jgi:hypothetical protein
MASRMLRSVLLAAAMLSLCGPAVAQDADDESDPSSWVSLSLTPS